MVLSNLSLPMKTLPLSVSKFSYSDVQVTMQDTHVSLVRILESAIFHHLVEERHLFKCALQCFETDWAAPIQAPHPKGRHQIVDELLCVYAVDSQTILADRASEDEQWTVGDCVPDCEASDVSVQAQTKHGLVARTEAISLPAT